MLRYLIYWRGEEVGLQGLYCEYGGAEQDNWLVQWHFIFGDTRVHYNILRTKTQINKVCLVWTRMS